MAFASANSNLEVALETTRGTAAAGTYTGIPCITPTITPVRQFLKDDAFRGSPVETYDGVQGVWHTEIDTKGYVYADTFPLLAIATLGPDVVSGAYVHTMKLANAAATGSQPASLTMKTFDGANPWQVTGSQPADFEVTGGADKALEWSAKLMGYAWTTPSIPTVTYSTIPLIPGWDVTSTINSVSLTYIEDFTLKINRKTAPIFTQGNFSPQVIFTGPCDVTGTLTYVVNDTSDPFMIGGSAYALYRDRIPFVLVATDPNTAATSVTFTMTTVQFQNVKRSTTKSYTEATVEFFAEANATDALTGYSPISIAVANAVASYVAS